jgi:amino acid adenylation domain-containing protein
LSKIGGVIQSLYARAKSTARAPALADERGSLCFADFLSAVLRLRKALEQQGLSPGAKVAICSENSVECVVAMYAVLDAGCAFVPLSPRDPVARLERLLARAMPALTLASGQLRLSGAGRLLDLAEVAGDAIDGADGAALPASSSSANDDESLAYVIFTSGSTGEPKGVCISNRSFFHAAAAAASAMGLSEATRSLAILPLHFDGSFSSVFAPLVAGGSVFVNRGSICPPGRFRRLLNEHRLTHSTLTPTYLKALVSDPDWSADPDSSWQSLALGGEEPPKPELKRLRSAQPKLKVFNRYGPTESTMAVSTCEISDEMLNSDERIPLGFPHPGVEFVTLKPQASPPGADECELLIGGPQLMIGYLDDVPGTEAVLARWLGDGRLLLKTGDLVRRDGAGRYVFVERVDSVVKRNGARIALNEVELALARVTGVSAAVCVKVKLGDELKIAAFLQCDGPRPTERAVRRELLQQLPASMSPDLIEFLDRLPGSTGGKVDRNALSRFALLRLSGERALTPDAIEGSSPA